ncbi:DUF1003 domain-containing protein [Taibaiella helva]
MARFGRCWKFILLFIITLMLWIIYNVVMIRSRIFDPYPFIKKGMPEKR